MKFFFTKLQLPLEPLTTELPTPDPRSLYPLSSTEFVEPPPNKIPGYATARTDLKFDGENFFPRRQSEVTAQSSRPYLVTQITELSLSPYTRVHST